MAKEIQLLQNADSIPRRLHVTHMENDEATRRRMVRFNGLLKSRNAPIALLPNDKSGFGIRIKSPFTFAAFGICLALFIIFTLCGGRFSWGKPSSPSLQLPTASHSSKCIYGVTPVSIRWNPTGTWITEDNISLTQAELLPFLKTYAREAHAADKEPTIRARIDFTQPVHNLVHLTKCMEEAGISNLHIATFPKSAEP